MVFQTKHTKEPFKGEINNGERLVETKGYIPADQQILALMRAGKNLSEYRREAYDFPSIESVDLNFFDPTRSSNFDMADATAINQAIAERIESAQATAVAESQNTAEPVNQPKEETIEAP